MPSINRIRVNNVKYNFGTQSYDDFSMRMYGRNTLYDLANGGGKSVLMLLLMQNLIPNSTLDDKQPIEKLFRDPSNTVIHSLIEWKLDDVDIKEGMRYMTTGFAARKAATTEEDREDGTAQIEYFNYVIFYRDYNKNDIVNLPLVKDNERISYKALRNYLHDLSRNDKNLIVQIFDRKGEYQRFIAGYGLYESHWEIIRGINKTEGHVRTYFESNYKTTRRVIEDLLIEEIIEKAYQAKTERESDKTESTVSLLMTIQEELKSLAEKKKGIQLYDHEQELVQLLIDRIESFMELYVEQEKTASQCGQILVTLENEKRSREDRMAALQTKMEEAQEKLSSTNELIEILKIYKDIEELASRNDLLEHKSAGISKLQSEINLTDMAYKQRVAENEYLELWNSLSELESLKREKKDIPKDAQDIYTVVANIRDRLDKKQAEIDARLIPLKESLNAATTEVEKLRKARNEGETEKAVAGSRLEYLSQDISLLEKEMDSLRDDVSIGMMMDPRASMRDIESDIRKDEEEISSLAEKKQKLETDLVQSEKKLEESISEQRIAEAELEVLSEKLTEYKSLKGKYTSICSIYSDEREASPENVEDSLQDRISSSVIKVYQLRQELEKLEKREADIRNGRLIDVTPGVQKVMDYLFTRHGITAMYGMDYLSALPEAARTEVLSKEPGIAYGIIVEDIRALMNDPGLMELDTDEEIFVYDKNELGETGLILGEGVECIRRPKEFFIDPKFMDSKLRLLGSEIDNHREELKNNEAMLETLREDMDFVRNYKAKGYATVEADFEELSEKRNALEKAVNEETDVRSQLERDIEKLQEKMEGLKAKMEKDQTSMISLSNLVSLQDRINEASSKKDKLKSERASLEKRLGEIDSEIRSAELKALEQKSLVESLNQEKQELDYRWENKYSIYYVDNTPFPPLDLSDDELESAFDRALGGSGDSRISLEKEKLLEDTLKATIDRQTRVITGLGIDIKDLEEQDKSSGITKVPDSVLTTMKEELGKMNQERVALEKDLAGINTEKARLEGSIQYAKERLESEFGPEAVERLAHIGEEKQEGNLKSVEELRAMRQQLKSDLEEAKRDLDKAASAARSSDELNRMATRIVESNNINISELAPLERMDNISENFDNLIMKYDKLSKDIDRARADMLKVKMNVYDTLISMKVQELAVSIRDDVSIPENRDEAEKLLKRLRDVIEIIILERDRVEKSLVSMQQLKDNFVDQCVERCLDVRTELDKLTKLSEITMGNEKVQMIRLSIPYVKDEFIKDRMSEYIDSVVEEVDKKETDNDRQKFLSGSLAMKKLFSVIVTDMSKIRLMLYKRERIKEQSRYLRYEEAVGSTGQSQGIYIQFLISIINYISGMYSIVDTTRSKTLFIDNPFGAAKDIYIWEPIFRLLEENKCQLIVPARGATPEITAKFDINYVLGQQMTGNRTTTVVVNYSSKTKGEELEYKDLDYTQQTFDFV